MDKPKFAKQSFKLAASAVFTALVFVATYSLVASIPSTSGYFNLGETVIYTAALTLGPLVGAISGGLGAMIADIMLAAQFAPGTLVIKGLEGLIVGSFNQSLRKRIPNRNLRATLAVTVGGLEMVAGYFVYEQIVLGYPMAIAFAEVPFNIVQMLVGLAVALPVTQGILRVFPQLKSGSDNTFIPSV
jgi:uncharacterized membrane protein